MDDADDAWNRWFDQWPWPTRFTVPTMAFNYFLEIPPIEFLEFVECPLVDLAYREFYCDCTCIADPDSAVKGVRALNRNSLHIRVEMFRRAVKEFKARPALDARLPSILQLADDVRGLRSVDPNDNRREMKYGWEGWEHLALFMRRIYHLAMTQGLPIRPYLQDPTKRIPLLLGVFMIHMRVQLMGLYPELELVGESGFLDLDYVKYEDWMHRFETIDLETHLRLNALFRKIDRVHVNQLANRYGVQTWFFSFFYRTAETNFRKLFSPDPDCPKPAHWWWHCEIGFAVPHFI
ncbi:hypothetical protein F4805DRAFT_428977 [Annulohypoxylon moriforme]|nr:hypothetical protein F4805DRAFT_428977 [Annulohypoxylon moriforme]